MNCWFWNIDLTQHDYFRKELESGRLRQGWGYEESLDLRVLDRKFSGGEPLSSAEDAAWSRCSPTLKRIKERDLVVVKNIPSSKEFTIVEVDGDYDFQIGELDDYGHILPIKKVARYNKLSAEVPAPLTNALNRERYPIRITYKHKKTVQNLATADHPREVATQPEGLKVGLEQIRRRLASELKDHLRKKLTPGFAERLVFDMLRRDGLDAVYNAGPHEQGADVLTEVGLGYDLMAGLAVQVKKHWGHDNDTTAVQQLRRAFEAHGVDAGLLVTFADELGEDLSAAIDEAKRELNVGVIYGDDLYGRLLEMIADPDFEPSTEE